MKVLHVIGSMNPIYGGPCQGIRNLMTTSKSFDIEREVVCLDDPKEDFLKKDTFPIYAVGPHKGAWWYSAKLIPWLTNNAKNYDVIVINGLWLYLSYAVWKVMTRLRNQSRKESTEIPKFYVMPHGMLDPYFQLASHRKLKALRNIIYWKLIERRVVNESDGLLFTCEQELQQAQKSFNSYQPKREINVGYGVPKPPTDSSILQMDFSIKCPEIKEQPYFLFFGRIDVKKGVDLLVRAYENILNKNLQVPKLVIAGPGLDSLYGQNIKQMVNSNKLLKKNVVLPGLLSGNAKWGALYGCEAFILPSYQENFGISVVEALACNSPVFISNNVNIWREIEMSGGGFIFQNSVEGVQSALEYWLNLSDSQKDFAKVQAKKTYEDHFIMEPVVSRFRSAVSI